MPKPKTVVTDHKANFETLTGAFKQGDVALMECYDTQAQEKVAVICCVVFDGKGYGFTPFARFFNGNPFEILQPPNPEGGFHA